MTREEQIVQVVKFLLDRGQSFRLDDVTSAHQFINHEEGHNWPRLPKESNRTVRAVLRSLEAVQLVVHREMGYFTAGVGFPFWQSIERRAEISPESDGLTSIEDKPMTRSPSGGSGGRGGGELPPGGDGFGQDGFGQGYREVLSHPYLFSLPSEDFDLLIGTIGGAC